MTGSEAAWALLGIVLLLLIVFCGVVAATTTIPF
jgi:ABC-type multidrug transport system permease subunit